SVYFRFRSAVLRGVSQLSVGQWWRIIGSFSALTIVFLKKNYRLLHYTAKHHLIPSYAQGYQQSDILLKILEHRANVCVTISAEKIAMCFFLFVLKCYCGKPFFIRMAFFWPKR
ncbi:hypothetical protein, partial [Xenorhabdus sp. PB30.3]|uniref:hypothetical protein n=1 Tax=Xenorhabdus sp. PB30.3 TaxID=2788941 RepID=UPI001E5168A4